MMMMMMVVVAAAAAAKTVIIVAAMVVLAENSAHLLPDSFPEPSIGRCLVGWFWIRVSHEAAVKLSARIVEISKRDRKWICFRSLPGFWQAEGPRWLSAATLGISAGGLCGQNPAAGFPQSRWQGRDEGGWRGGQAERTPEIETAVIAVTWSQK